MKAILIATLGAILVQPIVFVPWFAATSLVADGEDAFITVVVAIAAAPMVCVVAAPFVILIGIPAGLLLRHTQHRGIWLALIGSVAAATPWATMVAERGFQDGLGWRELAPLLVLGLHGLAGALAFDFVWRWMACETGTGRSGSRKALREGDPLPPAPLPRGGSEARG